VVEFGVYNLLDNIQALHANYSKREISRFMSISEAAVSKLSMDE
jgi:hypothetical protein